jgi:PAS domain S-box-containing protein
MEGNHQRESGTDTIHLWTVNHQANGNAEPRDLASANARLARENAELTAQLSRERLFLRALVDNMPDEIYFKDSESRFLNLNQSVAKNLGVATPAQAMGKTDSDFFPADQAREFRADEQKLMQSGEGMINKIEKRTSAGGKDTWTSTTKVPLRDEQGKVIGLVGINRDLTQLKQTEELLDREHVLLRTVLDNLPDSVYAKDTEGRFVLNNVAHAQRRGEKSPADMKGKSDFDYFPRDEAERFFADEQNILQTGEPILNQEQHTNGIGGQRWVVVSKVVWRDEQGNTLGTVGITRDVHEFKMAREALRANETKLRDFASQLERSNRKLQDFAYVASHDLQEPLRKIVVFGERLKEKAADRLEPETLDYLQRMQKAASRMQTLINDLLAFSRVTTKAQPFAPVDLAQTAQEVIEDLEGRIEMTKGRVELGGLPILDAEPLQMRQLFQNLVGNALKFRRPDVPPVVKIAAKVFTGILPEHPPDSAPQKLCELTVSDNGIGFDEKYLDRIFNVFQRLHSRNEYEGTGMGLAIVRKIVLHHGGSITARSAPGQGAAFIATLPVTHAPPNPTDT